MTTGMNAAALLYLISGLYEQILELQEQNRALQRGLEAVSAAQAEHDHEQGKPA